MTTSPLPLTGHSALITGGGSGIGLACAEALARDGAKVTICGRTAAKLEAAAASIGPRASWVVCDVADETSVMAAVDSAVAWGSGLTIAVVNAGTGSGGVFGLTDLAAWNAVIETNVTGAFLTMKHSSNAMSGGGSITAISSIAGIATHRYMTAYCVSKAALEMLVRNAADELGERGIRVNGVRPGLVPTDLSVGLTLNADVHADYLKQMPLGRTGTTDDIAQAVRYLSGPESGWVTGQLISVDGGHHLRRGPDISPLLAPHFGDRVTSIR